MGRAPCCEKVGLKKGSWTPEEDQKLTSYIKENGHGSWRALPMKAGLLRCGKSCRLRWANYLRDDIKRGEFSPSEEQTIIQLHALLGNRWSAIATHLPKRTDNEIKNYWNTHLKKRLLNMGIDPVSHNLKTQSSSCSNSRLLGPPNNSNSSSSSVSHMAQWESVRLEAEARLARETQMRAKGLWPPASSSSVRPWSSQQASCDESSKLDYGGLMSSKQNYGSLMTSPKQNYGPLMTSPKQNYGTVTLLGSSNYGSCSKALELMNTVQNWEKSMQNQAGLMWPDSWRFSNLSTSGEGQGSSCCSSPLDQLNRASPTSTLCFLDESSKQQLTFNYPLSDQARKLSWSDNPLPNVHNPLNSSYNHASKPLPATKLSQDNHDFQAISSKVSGEINLSSLSCLQDLIQFDGFNTKRDDSSMVSSTPALASDTNSSSLLGELELVSEDISSNKSSSDASGSHEIPQIIYSALLSEEYPDYWNNVLKEQIEANHESIPF